MPKDMRKFLRRIVVVLFFRVNWKKLFVIGTILTAFRVVFQIYSLPNPLTEWITSPPLDVASYQRLINHGNKSRELELSVVTSNNQLKMTKHLAPVVLLNSTARSNRLMRVMERRARLLRRRRRKRQARILEKIVYPPPPVVPDHLQVSLILCF